MLKELQFQGGCYIEETNLELFDNNRITVLYGKNGSGKSTISRAVLKAKGTEIDEIQHAVMRDEKGDVLTDPQCVHVFNEDYINTKVRIQKDGLNSIVLLGEMGGLEDQITILESKIKTEETKNRELKKNKDEFENKDSEISPQFYRNRIYEGLAGTGHWAEREKIIHSNSRNSSATGSVIDSIIKLQPELPWSDLIKRYENNLQLLQRVSNNGALPIKNTECLDIQYDGTLKELLAQKIERPELTDRERYLIGLINDGKIERIIEIKELFLRETTKICPVCFQKVTDQHKRDLVVSIEKVLSKIVDEHIEALRKFKIQSISVDFSGLDALHSPFEIKCRDAVEEINREIYKIEEAINRKIHHPYDPIMNFECDLKAKIETYETFRKALQKEIDDYNKAIKEKKTLIGRLSEDNLAIAYYEVEKAIERYESARKKQAEVEKEFTDSSILLKDLKEKLGALNAKKKNINIAVDLINKSLRYVFFSKDRMEIRTEDEKYVLYTNGRPVKPENISVGERNIIALSYFFTEIMTNQEAKEGYSQKMILVIDDPVSSFDFENKIGIMSLLKAKISDVINSNAESQVLIMTHDIQCTYDLNKIAGAIKRENATGKVLYTCKELKNNTLAPFSDKRNEYSQIMQAVYDYACNNSEDDLTIGNSMRRVLEAFSTFIYRKGIREISCDEVILQEIEDQDYRDYFKNLMYRLVLNGDSHMEERIKSMEDIDYLNYLSVDERRRTAQEVICFIYLLNKQHVMAHLKDKKDVERNIQKWCEDIKSFCRGE